MFDHEFAPTMDRGENRRVKDRFTLIATTDLPCGRCGLYHRPADQRFTIYTTNGALSLHTPTSTDCVFTHLLRGLVSLARDLKECGRHDLLQKHGFNLEE